MTRKIQVIVCTLLLAMAAVYLGLSDFSQKLETDVSSLLPQADSESAKLARRLISEKQGRAVYLGIAGLTGNASDLKLEGMALEKLRKSHWVESVVKMDSSANLEALKEINENRLKLLFPHWLRRKHEEFVASDLEEATFLDWAASSAVEDMDTFLESPMAIELARPEILDPLLLSIAAIIDLSESGASGGDGTQSADGRDGGSLYWLTLSESALSAETQDGVFELMDETRDLLREANEDVSLHYGGLVKLAAASRERIQGDVFKINLLSVVGVLLVASLMMRRPWILLLAVPTLVGGLLFALATSFLVFDQINVIVLVVGSILIGTTIDYAIHLILKQNDDRGFPTRRLVTYACLSTVVGFSILIFSDLALIRQIGVFVGAGLLGAYLVSQCTIRGLSKAVSDEFRFNSGSVSGHKAFLAGLAVLLVAGGFGLTQVEWKDDIRNLEAPNRNLVDADIALRERFGSSGSGSIFLSTGDSYLEVLKNESVLMDNVIEAYPHSVGFGFSRYLPNEAQYLLVSRFSPELDRFFAKLKKEFVEAGYDAESFEDFFAAAEQFLNEGARTESNYENWISSFSEKLAGPMAGAVGELDGRFWSLSSATIASSEAISLVSNSQDVTLFSQLEFLNQTLDQHRRGIGLHGAFAMGAVAAALLLIYGWRRGSLIVVYPILGGGIAIGICSLVFGELNLFHLVGCFLGGAIALDYALFAIESYARKRPIPHSVWLSAGTTSASFFALSFSSIPVVQGLGAMVGLLSCSTLLLLHASKPTLQKILRNDVST